MSATIHADIGASHFSGVHPITLTNKDVDAIVDGLKKYEADAAVPDEDYFGSFADGIEPTALARLIGDFDADLKLQIEALVAFCIESGRKIAVLSNKDRRQDGIPVEAIVPPQMIYEAIPQIPRDELDWYAGYSEASKT